MKTKAGNLFGDLNVDLAIDKGRVVEIEIKRIDRKEPFLSLFPFDEERVERILKSIQEEGYYPESPVLLWSDGAGRYLLIDGNHRLEASNRAGLKEIPAFIRKFNSADDAILHAIMEQYGRRNAGLPEAVRVLQTTNILELSHNKKKTVAELFSMSERKAQNLINLVKNGKDWQIEKVTSGEVSLSDIQGTLEKSPRAQKIAETKKEGSPGPLRPDLPGVAPVRDELKTKGGDDQASPKPQRESDDREAPLFPGLERQERSLPGQLTKEARENLERILKEIQEEDALPENAQEDIHSLLLTLKSQDEFLKEVGRAIERVGYWRPSDV